MKPEERVRKIFDNLSAPVLLIDRNYEVVAANHAGRAHMSSLGRGIVGRSCFAATHGLEKPCWQSGEIHCPVRDAFEAKKRARAVHKHRIRDRLVVEEIVATPFDEGTGDVDYVIEEFRDITELLDLRQGFLRICGSCKKIRDEKGVWRRFEEYIHDHTGADFSHSFCAECYRQRFPE
jgi:PAS domain-containing protein